MKKQAGKVTPTMEVSQTSQTPAFGPNLLKTSVSMSLNRVWRGLVSPFHEEQGHLVFDCLSSVPLSNAFFLWPIVMV